MKKMTTIKCMMLLVMSLTLLCAHANDEKDYAKFAAELREQVWNDDDPMFKDYSCPERYCNSDVCSAVILASSTDAGVSRKSRFYMVLWIPQTSKEITRHELTRMLIRLNDAAALKKFSEFDYSTFHKERTGAFTDEQRQVLGVRIIKPDGRIVPVNTDDYKVTREGKKDKDVSHKLAVPGLEVGDILDVFTWDEMVVHDRNVPHFRFWFAEPYPVLNYKVKCVLDKKFTVQYRTLNGAPDFVKSKDEEDNTVLEAQAHHVDRVEPTLWFNAIEQSPVTLLYVFDKSVTTKQMKSIKKRDVQSNPDYSGILADDLTFMWLDKKNIKEYMDWPYNKKLMKDELARASKMVDKEEAARLIYSGLLYSYRAHDKYNAYSPTRMMLMMGEMLDREHIPYQFVITTDYENEPLEQLINSGNTQWLIRTAGGSYFAPASYQGATAGSLPARFQGRRAAVITKLKREGSTYELVTLPMSSASDNACEMTVRAAIDGLSLDIERECSLTGVMKESTAPIMTNEQEFSAYDQYLGRKKSYMDIVSKGDRKGRQQEFEKAVEEQNDDFKSEIEGYHGGAPVQVIGCQLMNTGIAPSNPALSYKTHYTMDGWVKRAGSNLVVSVGKLIGDQTRVEGFDRQRACDVNRRCAARLHWDITVALPQGYQVAAESLERLQQHLKGEAGEFSVKATVGAGQLHLDVTLCYDKGDYPASQWQQLLQLIDAANDFTNRQIIFKK